MCDEFFSLPLFPPTSLCDEDAILGRTSNGCCGNTASNGCGTCRRCGTT